jgi:hypothetical protein
MGYMVIFLMGNYRLLFPTGKQAGYRPSNIWQKGSLIRFDLLHKPVYFFLYLRCYF